MVTAAEIEAIRRVIAESGALAVASITGQRHEGRPAHNRRGGRAAPDFAQDGLPRGAREDARDNRRPARGAGARPGAVHRWQDAGADMGTLNKRGGVYHANYVDGKGRRRRVSTRTG